MFTRMTGGEGRRSGGQLKTSHRCVLIVENLWVFREGSTKLCPLLFGVETAVGTNTAKMAEQWYQGGLEAAER